MGLFGFNEKDYKRNTARFTDALMELLQQASMNNMGEAAGECINGVIRWVARTDNFPSDANKKEVERIDKKIDEVLKLMVQDIQRQTSTGFAAHANILLNLVQKSRQFGKMSKSDKAMAAEEACAMSYAQLEEDMGRQVAVEKKMADLKAKGARMQQGDPALKLMAMQWEQLKRELDSVTADMNTHRGRYNANQKILELEHVQTVFKDMPPKISMDDVKASAREIMNLTMQESQYVEQVTDVADGALGEYKSATQNADVSGQSDFFTAIADEQTKNVFSGINNATVGEFDSNSESNNNSFSQDNPFAF